MDGKGRGSGREGKIPGNTVKVKFFATLRLSLGVASMDIEVDDRTTVGKVLDICSERLGADIKGKLLEGSDLIKGAMILVNGKNIKHEELLKTPVKPGDTISLFPPLSGG